MRYVKPSRTLPDPWGAPLSGTRDMEASIHSHETAHLFTRDLAWIERAGRLMVYIAALKQVAAFVMRKYKLISMNATPATTHSYALLACTYLLPCIRLCISSQLT